MYFINSVPAMFLVLFSALLTTVPTASAHLIMNTPVPYGAYANPPIDNSPLVSTGANFPCKVTDDPGTWYSQAHIADANTYAAGSVQTLAFNGSATHGGGSCQLALTSDMQPSAQTSWRVILSIESGCPTTDGVNPATYDWTVPADLAPGKYSFAWTWISKEAGQPEYYMNCAPITVTASPALKRRLLLNNSPVERRAAAAAAAAAAPVSSEYPELFVANLESVNSCKIGPDVDPLYPAPGPNVEKLLTGSTPAFASVTIGSNCVPVSQTQTNAALPMATAGAASNSTATTVLLTPTAAAAAVARSGAGTTVATGTTGSSAAGFATSVVSAVVDRVHAAAAAAATGTDVSGAAAASTMTLSVYVSPVTPGQHSTSASGSASAVSSASSAATVTGTGSGSGGGGYSSSVSVSVETSTIASSTETATATATAIVTASQGSSTISTTSSSSVSVTSLSSEAVSSSSSAVSQSSIAATSSSSSASSESTSSTTVETKSSTAVVSSTKTAAATTSSISASVSAKTTSTTSTSTTAPSATSTPASSGSGSNTTTTATTKSGTCTDEGMFNCVGSDYQQCASGGWTTMQALPAGTTCQQGESMGLWARSASVVDEVAGRGGKPGTEKRSAGEDAMRGKGNGEDKRKVKMWRDGRRRLGRVVGAQADDSS